MNEKRTEQSRDIRNVSDTALRVAMYRARESKRPSVGRPERHAVDAPAHAVTVRDVKVWIGAWSSTLWTAAMSQPACNMVRAQACRSLCGVSVSTTPASSPASRATRRSRAWTRWRLIRRPVDGLMKTKSPWPRAACRNDRTSSHRANASRTTPVMGQVFGLFPFFMIQALTSPLAVVSPESRRGHRCRREPSR
jgi:hypothetical protein